MRSISRKTAAWVSGAVIAVGGATAGIVAATSGGGSGAAHAADAAKHAAAKPVALRLVSISPQGGATAANGATGVTVTYNKPLPATAAFPTLSPSIAGSWQRSGHTVVFTPTSGYPADTKVTVTAADGTGSTAGTFTWKSGYPASLHELWQQGRANTVETGAITAFEGDHEMTTTETMSPKLWTALLKAAAANQVNTDGYSYAIANQHLPETLTIWHNGQKRLTTPANTGISVSPTEVGTFPVYEKLQFQIMSGTNPDGSHYADPVSWVSYFNGGDAVHYFPRGSYGWNQSLGCVELPTDTAHQAYDLLPYGSLVTVTEE